MSPSQVLNPTLTAHPSMTLGLNHTMTSLGLRTTAKIPKTAYKVLMVIPMPFFLASSAIFLLVLQPLAFLQFLDKEMLLLMTRSSAMLKTLYFSLLLVFYLKHISISLTSLGRSHFLTTKIFVNFHSYNFTFIICDCLEKNFICSISFMRAGIVFSFA